MKSPCFALIGLLLAGCVSTFEVTSQPSRLERWLDPGYPILMCPTVARAVAAALGGSVSDSCINLPVRGPRFKDYWYEGGWSYPIYMVGPLGAGQHYYYWLATN